MQADLVKTQTAAVKRAKKRSRFGCRNCKLRKLKCDETKPQCRRCVLFGVHCNFDIGIADLQSLANTSAKHHTLVERNMQRPRGPINSCLWVVDGSGYSYQLNTRCQDYLTRYMTWRPAKDGDHLASSLNAKLLALSFKNPHLMHACLAVSMAYDRHLDKGPPSERRRELLVEECLHRSRSTELFVKLLQHPVTDSDRDAVWATAASLAVLSFAAPAGTYVAAKQAWPLHSVPSSHLKTISSRSMLHRPHTAVPATKNAPFPLTCGPESTGAISGTSLVISASSTICDDDLQWLLAKDGKMSLWGDTNPLRADSIFSIMAPVYATMSAPLPTKGVEGVHLGLAELCGLDCDTTACPSTVSSTVKDMSFQNSGTATKTTLGSDSDLARSLSTTASPFHQPLHALSRLLAVPDAQVTVGHTEVFTNTIHGTFRSLLLAKDPRALLLLYLWYRKAGRCVWFVEVRARVEGPAICEYLRQICDSRDGLANSCDSGSSGVVQEVSAFLPGGKYEYEECLVIRDMSHKQ